MIIYQESNPYKDSCSGHHNTMQQCAAELLRVGKRLPSNCSPWKSKLQCFFWDCISPRRKYVAILPKLQIIVAAGLSINVGDLTFDFIPGDIEITG